MTKLFLNTVEHFHLVRDLVVKQGCSHKTAAILLSEQLGLTITEKVMSSFCNKNNIYKNRRAL